MTTSRERAAIFAAKHGIGEDVFIDLLAGLPVEQVEDRARALAEVIAEQRRAGHQDRTEAGLAFFLPPITYRGTGVRRSPIGVDAKIPMDGGRVKVYAGGRYHGPLSDAEIRAIERAGYSDRLCPHQPGSEAASRWEESLPVLPPDPWRFSPAQAPDPQRSPEL